MAKEFIMKKSNINIYHSTKTKRYVRAILGQKHYVSLNSDLISFNLVPDIDDRFQFKS